MAPQPLSRSFKRKYKKLHSKFSTVQSSTLLLEEDLRNATSTALKLIGDNDMLLDLLGDLSTTRSPVSAREQLAIYKESDAAVFGPQKEVSEYQPKYFTREETPEYFRSLPWDLDRFSYSGSHLEDLAKAASAAIGNNQTGNVDTPGAASGASARKNNGHARQTASKKRERGEGEEEINGAGSRKKKRKSILVPSSEVWEE